MARINQLRGVIKINGNLYETNALIQYDNSPGLNGNIVNKAMRAALKAIACELPKENHTPSNFKGILKECESLIDNASLISLNF